MPRVSGDEFVGKVAELFAASKSSGSVYITTKRASHPSAREGLQDAQGDSTMNESGSSSSPSTSSLYPIIFRLTNGSSDSKKRIKISTVILAHELTAFQDKLQPVIRQQLSDLCLRKRDKAKERRIDKEVAQRRKRDDELGGWKGVAKLGSKRGSGRRTRQRAVKRALKLRKAERDAATKAKAAELTAQAAGATESTTEQTDPSATGTTTASTGPAAAGADGSSGGASKKKKKKGKK